MNIFRFNQKGRKPFKISISGSDTADVKTDVWFRDERKNEDRFFSFTGFSIGYGGTGPRGFQEFLRIFDIELPDDMKALFEEDAFLLAAAFFAARLRFLLAAAFAASAALFAAFLFLVRAAFLAAAARAALLVAITKSL